ncbi:glycine cleavage system aminomethyltransferase GcvT [Agrococcus sp. Marseille-Q4369]|uniref:glycine cleavage system aminomethyltransferase GcvT n=1 Tax=Agrococcus sp. Marseille-Q4369 TaxID=2810513 RepID=UPI001B8AA03D|nr:glycine cleavage system aminomethyltransferase GcvT [Agrococcus sp. Marseille-Q4369]QUW18780.1 glycine cleavage system aminomethyltransferase GcvT [Agrococcus sp. Marseille-Q4369]
MTADAPQPASPLLHVHEEAGAQLIDFAGWQMPVRYGSDLAEHQAVRERAGLFDLSHMAELRVSGPDAGAFLDHALAGRISSIEPWQAKYSLLLAEHGGIVDDLIVYRVDESGAAPEYLVVANASNRQAALAALEARVAGFDASVVDETEQTGLVAVQGPAAAAIVGAIGLESEPLEALRYYRALPAVFEGEDVLVARTGYTGEDGFELYIAAHATESLWRAVVVAGAEHGLALCGLAARDTLRLEAGMPLYGNELSLDVLPAQVGLARVVALKAKGDFVGRAAVEAGPADDAPVLVALTAEGRRAPRAGYPVLDGDRQVGRVTSGALSPTLGHPIAMALVEPGSAGSDALTVDVRGTQLPATVTQLPFYKREA